MYMEQIFRTLQELEELLKLIDKSSPEVPDILYKLAVEKAEAVTEKVKGLPSVNSGIPEDKMVSGNDSERLRRRKAYENRRTGNIGDSI